MAIIVGFFVLCLCIALVQKLWKYGLKLLGILAICAAAVIVGIPVLFGLGSEIFLGKIGMRRFCATLVALITFGFSLSAVFGLIPNISGGDFEAFVFCLPAGLFFVMLVQRRKRVSLQTLSAHIPLFDEKDKQFYQFFFGSFASIAMAAYADISALGNACWFSPGYLLLCSLAQADIVWNEVTLRRYFIQIDAKMKSIDVLNTSQYLMTLKAENDLERAQIDALYLGISVKRINAGEIVEIELDNHKWAFASDWHRTQTEQLEWHLRQNFRHSIEEIGAILEYTLKIPTLNGEAYIESYLDFGEIYEFSDGRHFVHYAHSSNVRKCISCGAAFEKADDKETEVEWCCSDICRKTEKTCEGIRIAAPDKFLADAANSGFVVMSGAEAWRIGQRMFPKPSIDRSNPDKPRSTIGTGHGHVAERANNRIDQLMGKRARVIGEDNAKHGADRRVNGREIQTKYCSSARKSVNAAFDGIDGKYKYQDSQTGKAMLRIPPRKAAFPAFGSRVSLWGV